MTQFRSWVRRRRVPLFAIAGAVVTLALVLGIVFGVSRTSSQEADIADLADQGPLLPAGFAARTVPLEPQGSGSVVIPEGSLPEGTRISSSLTGFPVLPEGVRGMGQPVTITASEDPSGPIVIRLPMPEGSYDPSELVIIRVEQDGTTTFLVTTIEGDELVAATPGFSNFVIGLLDAGSYLAIHGPEKLLPGQRELYEPRANWERVSGSTWSIVGGASLVYSGRTAIVQAGEESGAMATLRYECIDPIDGRFWLGIKWITVVEDLMPGLPNEGEFDVSLVARTPIVYVGEDVLATAGVYGDFQGPITWEWDLDGTKGSATTGTTVTRLELPVQRLDVPKTYIWMVSATDAQGRVGVDYLLVRVLEERLSVTLDGPVRLSYGASEVLEATYTALGSGGSSSGDYLYYFQLLPGGDSGSGTDSDYLDPTHTVIFTQPGEYLLRVDIVEVVAGDEQDEPRSASAVLPIVVSGGEPLSAGIAILPGEAGQGGSVSARIEVRGGVLVVSGKKTGYRLKVDWGDGSPPLDEQDVGLAVTPNQGAEIPLSHSYAEPGTYTVTVAATDATGTSAYDSREITVNDFGTGGSPAATTTSEGTSGTSLLRFDGFYRTGGFAVEGESGTLVYYLRFYADGTVISVATTGDPEAVPSWFKRENVGTNGIVAGSFDVDGNQLGFSLSAAGGTVDYEGVMDGNNLSLDWYSNITGAQGHREYDF